VAENRFEVLRSQVMQCGVREMRRQETVREGVKCFGCGEEGHKKWECPRKKERSKYVEGCNACQQNKNQTQPPTGKLMPNSIPEKAWSHISADFITKLPLA